jgi:hypothetical protein
MEKTVTANPKLPLVADVAAGGGRKSFEQWPT